MAVPVLERGEPSHVVGFVTRESPFEARVLWLEGEERRERILGGSGGGLWSRIGALLHL
jgi:hypothetical protein